MRSSSPNLWFVLAVLGGIAYPFIVYFTMDLLPLWTFLFLGLMVLGLRLYGTRQKLNLKLWGFGFLVVTVLFVLLYIKSELGAVQAYPVIVSLSVASYFGFSLLFPPTAVERIARLTEPCLSPRGVAYTRRVTWIWLVFLLLNAAVSLSTILWGTMAQWTLWNGLVSYLLMGVLFIGEYIVRKMVRP